MAVPANVGITPSSMSSALPVTLNYRQRHHISPGGFQLFRFTPTVTGIYTFSGVGEDPMNYILYMGTNTILGMYSTYIEPRVGPVHSFRPHLNANQTYYVQVIPQNSNAPASYEFGLSVSYQQNFSTNPSTSDWITYDGVWAVSNGKYRQTQVSNLGPKAILKNHIFDNFTLEADVTVLYINISDSSYNSGAIGLRDYWATASYNNIYVSTMPW